MSTPRIAIAPDLDADGRASVEQTVLDGLRLAGGEPCLLAREDAAQLAELHALVLCGGAFDIPPDWYGQTPVARVDTPRLARSLLEREFLGQAEGLGLPVLGICGGAQLMAVHRGGTLVQDIAAQRADALDHERGSESAHAVHAVSLAADSLLARWTGATSLDVNSTHHQCIDRPGRAAVAVGWSPDGLVEAIEDPARSCWVGVQWHPEKLADAASQRLLTGFVAAAVHYAGRIAGPGRIASEGRDAG